MKIMYPKIKFEMDFEKDIATAVSFLKEDEYCRKSFFPLELQFFLKKEFTNLEREKIVKAYTNYMYDFKKEEIQNGKKFVEEEWKKTEKRFYNFTDKVFKKIPWPKGKYIGYTSIFCMFPRYLDEKVFFYPYSIKNFNPVGVIGHEMLHFIFFDFIEKKYSKKYLDDLDKIKDSKYVWRVSEAFNTVIENWEVYKGEMGFKFNAQPYPECKTMFLKMQKQWLEEPDIDVFLDKWLGS